MGMVVDARKGESALGKDHDSTDSLEPIPEFPFHEIIKFHWVGRIGGLLLDDFTHQHTPDILYTIVEGRNGVTRPGISHQGSPKFLDLGTITRSLLG